MNDSVDNFDKPVSFKKGQVIFAEGEASTYLYIVAKGEVAIVKEGKGRVSPISTVSTQDFIGELSMFNDEPRSATAIALSDCELVLVKKTDIRKVLRDCPDWVTNIMVTISDRLRSTVDVLREHRIVDEIQSSHGTTINDNDLASFSKNVDEYRKRRGL